MPIGPIELVSHFIAEEGWEDDFRNNADRFSSGIIGPGLAVSSSNIKSIQKQFLIPRSPL